MNKDLEETLAELGPDYRAVVERLRAAYEPQTPSAESEPRHAVPSLRGRALGWTIGYLVAASLFVAIAVGLFCREAAHPAAFSEPMRVYTVAYAPNASALEVILASQNADGSWSNDFLTQQNAAALRASADVRMRTAYRRAVRYLRSRGLSPLTDEQLKARGDRAAQVLARVMG